MKFGENLKRIRKELDFTQDELADKLNVPRQTISRWENSESYPESVDIEELCDIFNCKLDDLLNEKTKDLKSFDKETVNKVKGFKEQKTNNAKALSHVICMICKISKIVLYVAIPFILIAMLLVSYVINNIDIIDNDIVLKTDNIKIVENDELKIFNIIEIDLDDNITTKDIINIFKYNSKTEIILYLNASLLYILFDIIIVIFILKYIEKVFENLRDGKTPFTLANINYIKCISYLLIMMILVSPVSDFLLAKVLGEKYISNPLDLLNVLEILVIYGMSYIFEYGYEIEKDKLRK